MALMSDLDVRSRVQSQIKTKVYPSRGVIVFALGLLISAVPLLWPLTTTNYDPDYGKLPLWVIANCGVITIASVYSFVVICLLRRWGFLWIAIVGLFLIGFSLLAGFAFWALGILLFPVGPLLILAVAVLAAFPKNKHQTDRRRHLR